VSVFFRVFLGGSPQPHRVFAPFFRGDVTGFLFTAFALWIRAGAVLVILVALGGRQVPPGRCLFLGFTRCFAHMGPPPSPPPPYCKFILRLGTVKGLASPFLLRFPLTVCNCPFWCLEGAVLFPGSVYAWKKVFALCPSRKGCVLRRQPPRLCAFEGEPRRESVRKVLPLPSDLGG